MGPNTAIWRAFWKDAAELLSDWPLMGAFARSQSSPHYDMTSQDAHSAHLVGDQLTHL